MVKYVKATFGSVYIESVLRYPVVKYLTATFGWVSSEWVLKKQEVN